MHGMGRLLDRSVGAILRALKWLVIPVSFLLFLYFLIGFNFLTSLFFNCRIHLFYCRCFFSFL